jgi:hypothetical protein
LGWTILFSSASCRAGFTSSGRSQLAEGALNAVGRAMTAAEVAKFFKNAKTPRGEEILDTLVALGHARRTDSGYTPA